MTRSVTSRRHRKGLPAAAGALFLAAATVAPTAAGAAVAQGRDIFAHLDPLPDGELSSLRGGFTVGGFDFDIGLIVTSILEDIQVRTVLTLNSHGKVSSANSTVSSAAGNASFNVPNIGNGFEFSLTDGVSVVTHRALPDGIVNALRTNGSGTTSAVTTDLNIGVNNFSQVLNNAAKMAPTIRNMVTDLGIAGLN